ncbi:MAG: ROK family protein, partial [Bulleidia sp.]
MSRIGLLDIGGTTIKSGVLQDGILTAGETIPTSASRGAEDVISRAMDLLGRFAGPDAIGISTCGQVDPRDGSIAYANDNMPGYTGMKVREKFESRFHIPCAVLNDAYAAAAGEHACGAAEGASDFLCITYGTGIGAGIWLNGAPYYGAGPNAGIMAGGMIVHAEKRDDPWAGSYEKAASTTSLLTMAEQADPSIQNGHDFMAQAEHDPALMKMLDAWTEEISIGLCSFAAVYNIPLFVLGGGIMEQPIVFEKTRQAFEKHLIPGFRGIELKKARLGNQAGLYGAAAMAESMLA